MKCNRCNGNGKYKTIFGNTIICDFCYGTGKITYGDDDKIEPIGNKKPQTNEEWFDNLSTEEKAKVLRRKTYGNGEDNEREEQGWINWLQAKHKDNPPDIPSVPSWDNWLKGEKSKCELCDGSGEWIECNLVGRFECPKTPKTKQDWMQTCNTEQLARELAFIDGYDDVDFDVLVKKWIKWLKQPYRKE